MFFLFLSFVFWLAQTLNEEYEKELRVVVRIVDIPQNVVLTCEECDTVTFTVTDKGTAILSYMYGDKLRPINVRFSKLSSSKGIVQISSSDIRHLLTQRLAPSSKIAAIKPERLSFTFNYGLCKRLPVRWAGRVIPEHLYFISQIQYWPDSVTVYSTKEKLDSMRYVYTEPLNNVGFRDTLYVNANIAKTQGVKCIPNTVRIGFYTDVLTEEQIDGVAIRGVNLPDGKVLRTFPTKVSVRFVAGANQVRNIKPEDFIVIADYHELSLHPSDKCRLYLRRVPHGISRASLVNNEVDYLIEEE